MGGQRNVPAALLLGKRLGTHCIGGLLGPKASLDGCGKSSSRQPGFELRTVQPVAKTEVLREKTMPVLISLRETSHERN